MSLVDFAFPIALLEFLRQEAITGGVLRPAAKKLHYWSLPCSSSVSKIYALNASSQVNFYSKVPWWTLQFIYIFKKEPYIYLSSRQRLSALLVDGVEFSIWVLRRLTSNMRATFVSSQHCCRSVYSVPLAGAGPEFWLWVFKIFDRCNFLTA